jgi:hypothetical protein
MKPASWGTEILGAVTSNPRPRPDLTQRRRFDTATAFCVGAAGGEPASRRRVDRVITVPDFHHYEFAPFAALGLAGTRAVG